MTDHSLPANTGINQWTLILRRFSRHRLAVFGARVLVVMIFIAVLGPRVAPSVTFRFDDQYHIPLHNLPPHLWPFNYTLSMGTDGAGNPVIGFVLAGAGATLEIAVLGAILATLIGIAVGGEAGYRGGKIDGALMRLVDVFLTIPSLPLIMLLSLYLPDGSVLTYSLLFGLIGWPNVARIVRSYCLTYREMEFVEAARAMGSSDTAILLRHILPNVLDVLVVSCTLNVALFIVLEATLPFVGVGPTAATWGQALAWGYNRGDLLLDGDWWVVFFPGMFLVFSVMAVNFLGDGLRDSLDPRGAAAMTASDDAATFRRGFTLQAVSILVRPAIRWLRRAAAFVSAQRATLDRTPAGRAVALFRDRWARSVEGDEAWREREYRSPPKRAVAAAAVPAALVLILTAGVFLYGHAPLNYARDYTLPAPLISSMSSLDYAARPLPTGGWDLAYLQGSSLVWERVSRSGRTLLRRIVTANAETTTEPGMAWNGASALAVWVTPGFGGVDAALVTSRGLVSFPLVKGGSLAEHPSVISAPDGGFDVIFEWARSTQATAEDIYRAHVAPGPAHPITVQRLVHSRDYALYPRAIRDGSGALDLAYLDRFAPGQWAIRFRRFASDGMPIGPAVLLSRIQYFTYDQNRQLNAQIVPPQWALDVERSPDGSVWIAWEGDTTILVQHRDRNGRVLAGPIPLSADIAEAYLGDTTPPRSLSLAPARRGGQVVYVYRAALGPRLNAVTFGAGGAPERIDYDPGFASNPRAEISGRRIRLIWQKTTSSRTRLETSTYRPGQPPDLLTHLGLNIGNLWANLLLLILGSLAGGILVTVINVAVIGPLILAWPVFARGVPARLRWNLYLALIAGVLLWLLVLLPTPPPYLFVISPPGPPYGWLVTAGGVCLSVLTCRYFARGQEAVLRAASTVAAGLYCAAVMEVVLLIQQEIAKA